MLKKTFAIAAIGAVLAGPGLWDTRGLFSDVALPTKAGTHQPTSLVVSQEVQALARTYNDYYQQVRWQNGMMRLMNACYDYDSRRRKKNDVKGGEVPTSGRDVSADLLIADKVTNRPPYYSHLSSRSRALSITS